MGVCTSAKRISIQIQLINNSIQNLVIQTSIKGEELKQRIYDQLSQELQPKLMALYYEQTKIKNSTQIKDLKSVNAASSKIKIKQKKNDLVDIKGLDVNPSGTDPLTGEQGVAKMSCGHYVGRDSIVSLIRSIISSRQYEVRCPNQNRNRPCQALWQFQVCKKVGVLTKAELKELETGLGENFINKDCKQCPNCNQPIVKQNLHTNHVACPCGSPPFCYLCLRRWKTENQSKHCGNKQCDFYEGLLSSCEMSAEFSLRCKDGTMKTYMAPKYRACVHCKAIIQYTHRCKHMTCRSCKKQFCWICLAVPNGSNYKCGSYEDDCGMMAGRQKLI